MKRRTLTLTVAAALLSVLAVTGCTAGGSGASSTGSQPAVGGPGVGSAPDSAGSGAAGAGSAAAGAADSGGAGSGTAGTGAAASGVGGSGVITGQQIVTSGSMTLVADRPIDVADRATALVEAAGGHVDDRTEQTGDASGPGAGSAGGGFAESGAELPAVPAPPGESATLLLRIPSGKVTPTVEALKALATVQTMSLTSMDVTTQSADVTARITALQTSVARLLDLMSKTTTTADLISLENALSSRQADLDSLQAQLASLTDQTQYASVALTVVTTDAAPAAAPSGFWGGLGAGWSALVAAAGGALVALGFVLPWSVVLAIAGAVVLAGIRLTRRRTRVAAPPKKSMQA